MGLMEKGWPIVALALIVAILGVGLFIKLNYQVPEGEQPEVENVGLSYLAEHVGEFENKMVRVTGTVSHFFQVGPPKFWLDGVTATVQEGEELPVENSLVTVVGTVTKVGENSYMISAESWEIQPVNVDLTYLAEHITEFENKIVRTSGTVIYGPSIIMAGEFRLKAGDAVVCVLPVGGVGYPPENSVIIVEGTVHLYRLEGGFWAIDADNWSYLKKIEPEQGLGVFVVKNNIRLAMGIEKTEYQVGETINITFEVRNDSPHSLALQHPTIYGVFVFDVYDKNHVRLGTWPGSAGCIFHQTNIQPGDVYSENLEWDQKVHRFRGGKAVHWENSLGLGRYYIQGWIGGITIRESILRTPLFEITLENSSPLS